MPQMVYGLGNQPRSFDFSVFFPLCSKLRSWLFWFLLSCSNKISTDLLKFNQSICPFGHWCPSVRGTARVAWDYKKMMWSEDKPHSPSGMMSVMSPNTYANRQITLLPNFFVIQTLSPDLQELKVGTCLKTKIFPFLFWKSKALSTDIKCNSIPSQFQEIPLPPQPGAYTMSRGTTKRNSALIGKVRTEEVIQGTD